MCLIQIRLFICIVLIGFLFRVKSLSKGNNPKKDTLSSTTNLKESVAVSSVLPTASTYDDDTDAWPDQNEREDFDASEDSYEPEKPVWKKPGKQETFNLPPAEDKLRKPNGLAKWKDQPKSGFMNSNSDNDLNALLQVKFQQTLLHIVTKTKYQIHII